jgi:hypothetical protein
LGNGTNFTDMRLFLQRQQLTEFVNSSVQYASYMNIPSFASVKPPRGGIGLQTGKAMGKTRYFATASNGDITYPSNHVSRFSNPWSDVMYNGTQNIDPGFQQQAGQEYEDLSSASFYRVKITGGERQIYVRNMVSKNATGFSTRRLDSDDNIIY